MITDYNELLGQALGTCTLQRLIGRGGMGAVYLAQQSRPRRTIAVKVLMPGNMLDKKSQAEFLARFRREADAIASLDHVNIMPIYEYGEQGDIAYLVMPYVNGGTLREVLEQRGMLSLDEIVSIIEQAAAALDAAHSQGIIHRDLKPGNMLFHADGRLLLADFGLAKVLRDLTDPGQSGPSDLTSTGTIVGTPEYLSPEQGTGRPIDHRSDIYSLGIVLFQMLSGHVPFTGASPVAVAIKHALEEPPSLTQLNPTIAPEVEAVVMTALAKEPYDRYNSAGKLAEALRKAVYGQDAPPPSYLSVKTPIVRSEPLLRTDNDTQPEAKMHNAPTEAAPLITPERQQVPPTPATNPIKAREANFHGSPTEKGPRVLPTNEEAIPTMILSNEANVKTPDVPAPLKEPQVKIKPAPSNKPGQPRGCQSISMMLLGSVLTLVLVVGFFASYVFYFGPNANQKSNSSKPTVTATTKAQTQGTSQTSTKPLSLPPATIPAGTRLYGTDLPGPSCDTRGGKWRNSGGVSVTCGGGSTILANNTGSNSAGIYLDTLPPNQPLPSSYMVQLQIDANVSHGVFYIYFFNQTGSQTGWDRCEINPGGHWQFSENKDGSTSIFPYTSSLQKGPMRGTVTVNLQIQGSNSYTLFTNGTNEGADAGGNYTSGGFGLGVESGAQVSVKNVAIYALS